MNLQDKVREAGIVGAGGAGFPTHVKIAAQVEYVIANGAECEPLLHKDRELMIHYPEQVVSGLKMVMQTTGASQGIIGIKAKNKEVIEALERVTKDSNIKIHLLGDYYPTGDEFVLVSETTGRLIPPAGIPLEIGVVVNNVETLYNIACASIDQPVVSKFLTVAGAVQHAITFVAPIGTSYREAIGVAGGATVDDFSVFVGGVMMGRLEKDLDTPITKTTTGLIVLPSKHKLAIRKSRSEGQMMRIGKSACDQCSYCTEFCPRYLLGYDVQPHKVMRSLGFTTSGEALWNRWGYLCCACGLCTLYACPEDLFPKEACDKAKRFLAAEGIKWKGTSLDVQPHLIRDGRQVPLKRLIQRLGLVEYDRPTPFEIVEYSPKRVRIPLLQHIGIPAEPRVSIGERVKRGQIIADIPSGKLGAKVHASIDGVVKAIDDDIVLERY